MSSATTSSGSTSYLYNSLGELIEKSGNGGTTLLVYDEAGHLLGEYSSSGALIQETIWMGDIPVATLRPNGASVTIYYVHTDHLGTPRKVTRPSDNGLMWRFDPDAFGSVAPNQDPAGLGTFVYNLRFPGQYVLAETGLYYNDYRDYDPAMGRYIESDPVGLRGGINTYAYGNEDPLTQVDPSGLFSLSVGASWSTVSNIPGNTWYGWLAGGTYIGLTKAYLAPAQCHCNGCGGSWKLGECSAFLDIEVMIQANLNPSADAFARHAEGEHVADLEAGAGRIHQAGAAAERVQSQRTFSDQSDCEVQSSNAVTAAIRSEREVVSKLSAVRDTSGSHTYPGIWPF